MAWPSLVTWRVVGPVLTAPRVVGSCGRSGYFARWRIFLRLRWRRRVRFCFGSGAAVGDVPAMVRAAERIRTASFYAIGEQRSIDPHHILSAQHRSTAYLISTASIYSIS